MYKGDNKGGRRDGKSFGDRKGFGANRSFGDRGGFAGKKFGDRQGGFKKREFGDKGAGFVKREGGFGERKSFGAGRSFGDRPRSFGDRKPFGDRPRSFGDRKPFGDRKSFGAGRSFGDRPRSFGDRGSFGARKEFGDRKPFGDRPRSFGDRKPFGDRPRSFGDRKPFGDRKSFGAGRTFGDRPRSFGDRKFGDRPRSFDRKFEDKSATGETVADKKETSWGKVAAWYQGTVAKDDSYQKSLIIPNLVRLMDIKPGDSVIEFACGEGNMSRAFHEAGAKVTGADISPELIELAKKNSPAEIEYMVSPADDMSAVADKSYDKAAIVLALQNIEKDREVMAEMSRVIKDDGRIVIVLNHPCFRIPKQSSWGFAEDHSVQYRKIERYISDSKETIEMHPGDKVSETTVSFHHPLQHYFKAFDKANLAVTRLEEWVSEKNSVGARADAENRARKEIPMFMALVLKKM